MADLNNQQHLTVAGGTEVANLNDDPGSPLNVVPHNLSLHFAFNEDEDALVEGRVSLDPEPISSEITPSILNQNGLDDDEDGVQDCTFTQLLSTGVHADEEFYVHHTPNGTRMWCPNVPIVLKPVVGSVYETWKDVFRQLRSIFWADEISKINYEVFGDVLAFDATYHTNKYNMIFVPFTGVDNHKQCVTFGAGLLFNETTESYKWLLESFLKAHKKQPKLVLTDQDPSMKAAISEVFTDSRHRLCMWHIMKKLPTKIAGDLLQNSELRALMHRLVWSIHMKPSTFETRWQLLMEEYGLQDHDWLKDMYSIRDQWVPAYFRDIPMCCLMKTTSRCESSNSSFKVNSSSANTLVQFMLCYETRIDNQRYRQRVAEFKTSSSVFMDSTGLAIEKHAFELYTHAISTEVRKEIYKGKLFCYIVNTEDCDEGCVYYVNQLDKRNNATNTFTVILELSNQSVSCSCNNFIRIGYLCRHIFCVYRVNNIERIPAQYVVKRWSRDVLPKSLFSIESRYGVDTRPQAAARSQILEIVTECVDALRSDVGGLSSFAEQIKELKCKLLNGGPVDDEANNDNYAAVEELLGVSLDGDVTLDNPDGIRNKGRGKRRRLSRAPQDGTSNSAVKPPKTPRLCRTCMKYVTGHDSRNCKKKKNKNKNKSGNEDEDEDSSSASQEST
ncbi:protein FAR1-RELATED SEQUENCE 5-like [Helianthus annuus]|uniref:protein FAR1-RELATED SEQUENCE 5-like n=1 Tax=Helianthus annuus TaxID=4232 RepID=UPI001652C875|nr:protein FAR1-RELATED SEQUENCE 5-like [Helianthus annuus]